MRVMAGVLVFLRVLSSHCTNINWDGGSASLSLIDFERRPNMVNGLWLVRLHPTNFSPEKRLKDALQGEELKQGNSSRLTDRNNETRDRSGNSN